MTNTPETGEIVPLQSRLSREREAHLDAFVRYWESMRRGGDVPHRSEIDPRGIEALLENALIMEKVAPGLARLRIAGTHLSDLMGMEVRGMPISAFIEPGNRIVLADALTELFERPAQVRLSLHAKARLGAPEIKGQLMLLPLRSDLGDVSRALGCLITEGRLGRTPHRFAITHTRITSLKIPSQQEVAHAMAEAPAPFEPEPGLRGSERPYLRLVR